MPDPTAVTDPARAAAIEELRKRIGEIDWYHTQELAPGLVTTGMFDLRPLVVEYGIPADLSGKRVLDVGTFEGFWAFELERRGAEVVAVDIDDLGKLDWPRHLRPAETGEPRGEGFGLARRALGSRVERVTMTVYDITPERLGTFDLVFCGSVMIHVRDPVLALEHMADVCAGRLIIAEEHSRKLGFAPFNAAEFRGDSPWMTWWIPSAKTWLAIIRTAGFLDPVIHSKFNMAFRERRGGVPHVVIHARGPGVAR